MASARLSLLAVPAALAAMVVAATPADAQAPRNPPVLDEFASPFTDSEIGGLGCLAATVATGTGMTMLMGGTTALAGALRTILTPRLVLEASAAGAFVFSSACYVGQALAPVVMLGYTTLLDSLTAPALPSPGSVKAPAASAVLP